jgi:hypothetical protein
MLLLLAPSGGEERKLWVTRRLWLALYREVAALAPSTQQDDTAQGQPPPRPKAMAPQDAEAAEVLTTIRISRRPKGAALIFEAPGGPVNLDFAPQGLVKFRQMLETQADRAGWDASAAMERLRAEAAAGAAVKRAST